MNIKVCSRCGVATPLDGFAYGGGRRIGSQCKACDRERKREAYWRAPDRERDRSRRKENGSRYPDAAKVRVRRALLNAVNAGRIERPGVCEQCGVSCKPQGHHEDYTKPFEVRWLCTACHGAVHRLERELAA